jgi:4-amino-4-deoxy-L-arabinose transferase-like glycosyltransferase
MRNSLQHFVTTRLAWLLPAALSAGLLFRRPVVPVITMDGVTYLQIARNVLGGQGLGWQALWAAPLHSLLIALAARLTGTRDLAVAAGLVAPLMGFGLVLSAYFLARELFDRRAAVVAACLVALSPHLLNISRSDEGEITYAFFLTLALGLFVRAARTRSLPWAILSGGSFAFAYLARSEGFLVTLLVLGSATLLAGRRYPRAAALRLALAAIIAFVLVASPYLLFLRQNYGAWVVSPKAAYVMIWMKSRVYHDNDKGEMGNEELWGLSPEGRLRWQEPRGVGDLVRYLASHPGKSLRVYLANLSEEIPGRIPNNSGMERYPQVYPVYLALAALMAAWLSWGEEGGVKKRIALAPFAILFVLPVFTGGWWKYLVPYLPLLLVLAARGLCAIPGAIARFFPSWECGWRPLLLVTLVVVLLGVRFQWDSLASTPPPAVSQEVIARRGLAQEARKAGEWAAARFGPGRNYMIPWSRLIYWLDGYWTALPVAPLDDVLAYGRAHRAEYLVEEMAQVIPTDQALAASAPGGLELAAVYRSESCPYAVAFYRLR